MAGLVLRCFTLLLLLGICSVGATVYQYPLDKGSIYAVQASQRLSETQLFARDISINQKGKTFDHIGLFIDAPGRTFISFVENTTALNNNIYGKIRVSGSSEAAVKYIKVFNPDNLPEFIEIQTDHDVSYDLKDNATLLIEIELYAKQSLKHFRKYGGDVVILENVLFTRVNASETVKDDDGAEFKLSGGGGNLFIHDPTATVSLTQLSFVVSDVYNGSVQVELKGLNTTTRTKAKFFDAPHDITLLIDEMSPVELSQNPKLTTGSVLCIASSNDVNVTTGGYLDTASERTSEIRAKGGSCTKKPLPERKPAYIDAVKGQATAQTAAPPAAASSSSSASRLGEVLGPLTLLSLALAAFH